MNEAVVRDVYWPLNVILLLLALESSCYEALYKYFDQAGWCPQDVAKKWEDEQWKRGESSFQLSGWLSVGSAHGLGRALLSRAQSESGQKVFWLQHRSWGGAVETELHPELVLSSFWRPQKGFHSFLVMKTHQLIAIDETQQMREVLYLDVSFK